MNAIQSLALARTLILPALRVCMHVLFILSALTAGESTVPVKPGWKLAFHDEFDAPGRPDPKLWTYEQGFVRNEEMQWYQSDNASVADGCLIIEGRRERIANPGYDPSSKSWRTQRQHAEYTSSSLTTKGLFSWTYGLLEVRATFSAQRGLWPAIWTLGVEGKWPANGEVDLFEYYQDSILANAFWLGGSRVVKKPLKSFGENWADQWHVWSMDWNAKRMLIAIDGQTVNEIDLTKVANKDGSPNPFLQPHYLLLNLAIGGKAGGNPAQVTFPTRYQIDWVRVWQAP